MPRIGRERSLGMRAGVGSNEPGANRRVTLATAPAGGMRVDGVVYASEEMARALAGDPSLEQVANVAHLPGIVGASLAMPDIHWGYGFPIGGVAAMEPEDGVISPGGVGYDINCGVRLLRSALDREATEAENFRRLLLASMDDVRVILVKLADRLHNMRTLSFLRPDRQVAIAQETLDIYAPIANRLGIGSIKMEMEDLCFRYLHPKEWERLEHEIKDRAAAAERWFAEIREVIEGLLADNDLGGTVQGRVKHMYSVYQKLRRQEVDVANVFDFLAFRIVVESVGDCYAVLGLIHQQWPPVPGRMKDHIAIPKPNAYQSLHTTVLGPEAHPFEIQIRTWDMHKIAEFGIAAHWSYKEKGSGAASEDSRISWLRSLLDNSEGASPREFLDSIKVDLYPDDVYCFTPRGDVFSFPRGARILDFAYRVHTEVGHTCVGGRINSRWVPLRTELKNGDIVEISTSPQQRPHHDWLNLVGTNRARAKIRSWLKEGREEARGRGRAQTHRARVPQGRCFLAPGQRQR